MQTQKQIKFFATGEKIQKSDIRLRGFVGAFDLEFYALKNTMEGYYFALDFGFARIDPHGRNLLAVNKAGALCWVNPRSVLRLVRAQNNAKGVKIKGV